MNKGYLPERIVYVFPQYKDKRDNTPAFPIEHGQPDHTATSWAQDFCIKYSWVDGERRQETIASVEKKVRKNEKIEGLRIVGLVHRGNGGRAYKVVDKDNFLFDLREDMVMEVIEKYGIAKGGILGGSFVWGKVSNQMKLVLVGSELHQLLTKGKDLRQLSKVSAASLKPGGLYETKGGKKMFFLGWVEGKVFGIEEDVPRDRNLYASYVRSFKIFCKESYSKRMLWYSPYCGPYGHELSAEKWKEKLEKEIAENGTYGFEIKRSHSCVRLIDFVQLPKDIALSVRMAAIARAEKDLAEGRSRYLSAGREQERYNLARAYTGHYGDLCYMHTVNHPEPPLPARMEEIYKAGRITCTGA